MARYTTPQGICSEGEHEFTETEYDKEVPGIGRLSPKPPTWEVYYSQGIQNHRKSNKERVCQSHFVEQYKARWPDADLSQI